MNRISRSAVLACFLAGLLGACQTTRALGGAEGLAVVPGGQLPAPDLSQQMAEARPYYIGPLDKLAISVFGVEALSQKEIQVDSGGHIEIPLIGTVQAGGRTPDSVAREIEDRLRGNFVRNPQVALNVTDTVSQMVTVEGEVKEPGIYPVVGKMSLLRAVARAKGTSQFASTQDVVVFRTTNGQRYAALYNLSAIRRGAYLDPDIYPDDVVTVGKSKGRQLFQDFLGILPAITSPIVLALTPRSS